MTGGRAFCHMTEDPSPLSCPAMSLSCARYRFQSEK